MHAAMLGVDASNYRKYVDDGLTPSETEDLANLA
jgi:hypothetical protein